MKNWRRTLLSITLSLLLISGCSPAAPSPLPTDTSTPTLPASPTASSLPSATASLTPTPDPSLPCGGVLPERNYLFMDCSDIRRIRQEYQANQGWFMDDWKITRYALEKYEEDFPSKYDPNASWDVLWWGDGNFMPRDMGLFYLVTGEQHYADDILRLLQLVKSNTPQVSTLTNMNSPDANGNRSAGGIFSHPQFGAVVIQSLLFGYFTIRDSAMVDDATRQEFDQFFQHQAQLLVQAADFIGNNTPLLGTINRNVPLAANLAALTIARAYPDDQAMKALDAQVWPILKWQLENWWQPDGGWGEDTQNYGFSRLESILLLTETSLRNDGIDLYAMDFGGHNINRMCRFFLDTVTPEGTVAGLNDTSNYPVDPGLFNLCAFRTRDDQLLFAAQKYDDGRHLSFGVDASSFTTPFHLLAWVNLDQAKPVEPSLTSVLLPGTGVAILRDGWTRDSSYALLQFTASRVHQEQSFGELYLFSHGPWLTSNGYNLPKGHPTNQHSTLGMDNLDQTNTGGQVTAFADLGQSGVSGVSSQSYPNLKHTRLVLWIKPWSQWIVVDDALGDQAEHSVQQRWFVHGTYDQVKDNTWIFNHEDNHYQLTIQMLPGVAATYARIKRQYNWEDWVSDAVGVRMEVAYSGQPLRLVTALSVAKPAGAPKVTRIEGAKGTQVDSQLGGITWTWLLPGLNGGHGESGNYSLDGVAGCTWSQSSQMQGYCLMNGTSMADGTSALVKSDAPVYLEVDLNQGLVILETGSDVKVSFFWPDHVLGIKENGASIDFHQEAGLVSVQLKAGRHQFQLTGQ